jgi:hypothetical protein
VLADRPEGVDQVMPVYLWADIGAAVLLLLVLIAGYWWMFGLPCRKSKYQGRRRVDPRIPDQLRPAALLPASTLPPLPCDDVEVLPVGAPLALEAAPRPYRYASRAQHKEPLAEELTW